MNGKEIRTNDLTQKGGGDADEDDAFELERNQRSEFMPHREGDVLSRHRKVVTLVQQDVAAGGNDVLPARRSNRELAAELEKGFDLDIDLDEGVGSCDAVSLSCSGGGPSDVVTVTRTRTLTPNPNPNLLSPNLLINPNNNLNRTIREGQESGRRRHRGRPCGYVAAGLVCFFLSTL
jgi:hypothetical protein